MISGHLERVGDYYSGKIVAHGATAQGVDWRNNVSQQLRFTQLLKIIAGDEPFTINDLGCGYGALSQRLETEGCSCDYLGLDISAEMVNKARELHRESSRRRFVLGSRIPRVADYTVASGVFNVRLDTPVATWHDYVLDTVTQMADNSTRGVAFNCLTRYSDPGKMRPDLYYADPLELFDYCKRNLARNVALLHDYGLYEFTILVRKEL